MVGVTSNVWFPSKKHLLVVLTRLMNLNHKRGWSACKRMELINKLPSQYGSAAEIACDTNGTFATSVMIEGCSCVTSYVLHCSDGADLVSATENMQN